MLSTTPIPDQVAESKPTLRSLSLETLMRIVRHTASLQDASALIRSFRDCYRTLETMLYREDAKDIQPRALLWAAVHGNDEVMRKALRAGTDLDTQFTRSFCLGNYHGLTSVLAAAASGHTDMVRHLLDVGANPRGMDQIGFNALHYAARAGHEATVRLLLRRFPSLLYDIGKDDFGLPAAYAAQRKPIFQLLVKAMDPCMRGSSLEAAAFYGHDDIFEWLIEHGTPVAAPRKILDRACLGSTEGHIRVARVLIRVYGNDEQTSDPATLYKVCWENGPRALEMAGILLDRGDNPTRENSAHRTPLSAPCEKGNVDLVNLLLPKSPDEYGVTAREEILEAAFRSPNMECSNLILERFPLKPDSALGTRLLTIACQHKNEVLVKLLLARGVSAKWFGSWYGEDLHPLKAAWASGSMNIIKLLLHEKADPNAIDASGFPILAHSEWPTGDDDHQLSCLKLLLKAGAKPFAKSMTNHTPLHAACLAGAVDCVRFLLNMENDNESHVMCASNTDQMTPLHAAVVSGKLEIVKMLIEKGANAADTQKYDYTALHDACNLEQPAEMVEYLLSKGADPCLGTNSKRVSTTPYRLEGQWSAWSRPYANCTPLILLLQSRKAPPPSTLALLLEYKGQNLDEALAVACRSGHFAAVRTLLDGGVDVNSRWTGIPPLCCASDGYHLDVVKLLVARGADVNARGADGRSALGMNRLALGGIIKFLLASGANVWTTFRNDRKYYGIKHYRVQGFWSHPKDDSMTMLSRKICPFTRNRRALELFLDEYGRQNAVSSVEWQTMLVRAAKHGGGNLIRLLIERRLAHLDIADKKGRTVWVRGFRNWEFPETSDTILHLSELGKMRV